MGSMDASPNKIQNAAIFEKLPPDHVNLLLSRASVRAAPKGTFIFREGEPAREMFLLESGRARLQQITAGGREFLLRFIWPGEVFGDKAAIEGADYSASAISDTLVRTYSWKTTTIAALLEEMPQLAKNLFAITARYLHYSRERYRLLATEPVERRIHWAVAELAHSIGRSRGNTVLITGPYLQRDIAELAEKTKYTVSRVLSDYEHRGVLTRERGRIVLSSRFR
jgi:CRP-like cAMP-binding protein